MSFRVLLLIVPLILSIFFFPIFIVFVLLISVYNFFKTPVRNRTAQAHAHDVLDDFIRSLAILTKADGRVHKAEIATIEAIFSQVLRLNAQARQRAILLFRESKNQDLDFRSLVRNIAVNYRFNTSIRQLFFSLYCNVAKADGNISQDEKQLLFIVCDEFGIPREAINQFTRTSYNNAQPKKDPWTTLGVPKGAPIADVKKVWRRKRRELHPDTIKSKGMPDELIPKAKEQFAELSNAYEEILEYYNIKS